VNSSLSDYSHASLNNGDTLRNASLGDFIVVKRHRVYLHKPK